MEIEKRFDNLEGKVDVLQTDVSILKTDVSVLKTDVSDLIEVVHDYAEKVDRRFETVDRRFDVLEQKVAALPTRTEMRELVQDVVDRSWDRALAKVKQVDMHVDAVVDTLADDGTIAPSAKKNLHAMQPFPKLVKDA